MRTGVEDGCPVTPTLPPSGRGSSHGSGRSSLSTPLVPTQPRSRVPGLDGSAPPPLWFPTPPRESPSPESHGRKVGPVTETSTPPVSSRVVGNPPLLGTPIFHSVLHRSSVPSGPTGPGYPSPPSYSPCSVSSPPGLGWEETGEVRGPTEPGTSLLPMTCVLTRPPNVRVLCRTRFGSSKTFVHVVTSGGAVPVGSPGRSSVV